MAILFYILIFLIITIIMTMKQNNNFYFHRNYKPIKRKYPYYKEININKNFFRKIPKLFTEDKDNITYHDKEYIKIVENKVDFINYHIVSDVESDIEINSNYSEINMLSHNNTMIALNYEDYVSENDNNKPKIILYKKK